MSSESTEPSLEEILSPFLELRSVIVQPVSTLTLMYFIYGFYILLVGICLRVLWTRKAKIASNTIYIILLFLVATLGVIIETVGMSRQIVVEYTAVKSRNFEKLYEYLKGDIVKDVWFIMINMLIVIQNAINQGLITHRCYIIWNSNRILGYSLGIIAVLFNLFGIIVCVVGAIGVRVPSKASLYTIGGLMNMGWTYTAAGLNVILTLLTAGKLWWFTHQAKKLSDEPVHAVFKRSIALLLETGAIYPAMQLITITVNNTIDPEGFGLVPIDLSPIVILAAGIAPTLIVIRVAYGSSVGTSHGTPGSPGRSGSQDPKSMIQFANITTNAGEDSKA